MLDERKEESGPKSGSTGRGFGFSQMRRKKKYLKYFLLINFSLFFIIFFNPEYPSNPKLSSSY
jgi:hypothetical protein